MDMTDTNDVLLANSSNGRRIRFGSRVLFTGDPNDGYCKSDDVDSPKREKNGPSLLSFLRVELTRGYVLEHDEERYSARREKVYSFMKIPREVEKFMSYGFMQCADSFLYVYTFLPLRVLLAVWALFCRPFSKCFGSV